MEVLDWMIWIHDWNFWKASLDMVIALKVVEKGISCTVSCISSLHGGNVLTGFKAQDITCH
jgi:hypothetical protein